VFARGAMKLSRLHALGAFIAGIVSVAIAAWLVGGLLIAPVQHAVPMPADLAVTPQSIPGPGHAIAAWWHDGTASAPVVLLLHGVRGSRLDMVQRARVLAAHGYAVLMIDLQAHGETLGDAITFGWREALDVRAAIDWARHAKPASRIGVVGTSLGGASALLGPQPLGVDAVVLESVYPRLQDAVEDRIRMRLGFAARVLAPVLLAQVEPRLGVPPARLAPIESVARVGAPVLIAAGTRDEHTPPHETREMFAAARSPKELWWVDGAAHQDLLAYDPEGYRQHVVRFLDRYLKAPRWRNRTSPSN